jgi:CRP/FNR family transcriptional regulator, cyclic AMP receptor protein
MSQELEFLSKVLVLSGVSEDGLKKILSLARERRFEPGKAIITEGESGDSMYIIKQGEVEISMSITLPLSGGEKEKVLVRLGPGANFGEMAFIFGKEQRSATVSARNDVTLLEIKSSDFDKFVEANPKDGVSIFRNVAKIVSERLRKANHDVAKLTTVLSVVLSRVERIK